MALTFTKYIVLIPIFSLFLWSAEVSIDQSFKRLEKQAEYLIESLRMEHQQYIYRLKQKQILQLESRHRSNFFLTLKKIIKKRYKRLFLSNLLLLKNIEKKTKQSQKRAKMRRISKSSLHKKAFSSPLLAKIRISKQKMYIYKKGKLLYCWKVSTGKKGHHTPTGIFRPILLSKHYRSRKYNNASMPYAVFFRDGYAVHGTKSTWRLGRRASHGCIRLHPSHAKIFYNLVRNIGLHKTKIHIPLYLLSPIF